MTKELARENSKRVIKVPLPYPISADKNYKLKANIRT